MKHVLMICTLIVLAACGEKARPVNQSVYSSTLLEKQCLKGSIKQEQVTRELEGLYNQVVEKAAWIYFSVPERNFDYNSPLVINLDDLKKRYKPLKEKIPSVDFNDLSTKESSMNFAYEIFNLYQDAVRYEGSKCQLRYLSSKAGNDIIPYMTMKDFCLAKNDNEICPVESLLNLDDADSVIVKDNTVKMCTLLTGEQKNCQETFEPSVVSSTQTNFRDKKFNKLFRLKDNHLKFQCEKNEDVMSMKLKVYSPKMEQERLKSILESISTAWSRSDFKISFEIVEHKGDDVIEIIPTSRPVSFVMEHNNRLVYLSSLLDIMTVKKVMAHEFGHVLGFPDCYTEYYDSEKKSLIYYEISKENKNIMCSMKNGVSVPADYIDQLVQKSCIFSQK